MPVRTPDDTSTPANFYPTCLTNAKGKILRIALDGSIPPDNPLVGVGNVPACGDTCESMPSTVGAPREAIWAWGFRNPFRLWVDPKTGIPWVADVGERAFEEIDLARRGGHYGWPWREGRHGYPIGRCAEITGEPCEDPVYECAHGGAGPDASCVAITGGAILDESWPAAYRRRYWFSDSGSATLSALEVPPARDGVVGGSRIDVAVIEGWPIAVRPGPDGNLYVLSHFGRLVRVRPRVRQACEPITLTIAGPPSLPTPPTPEMHEETLAIHADDLPWVTARGAGCRAGAPRLTVGRTPWLIMVLGVLVAIRRRRRGHETCSRGAQ